MTTADQEEPTMGGNGATGPASTAAHRREASFTLRLGDDLIPAVKAGQFRITARQEIEGVDTGDHLRDAVREFEVRAPQFVLPPDTVHAVNPAPDAAGGLGTTLPHATLDGRLLPWLRDIDPEWVGTGPVEPRAPWLALLVFAAGELPGDPMAVGETDRMTVQDLLWPATPEPGVLVPAIPRRQVEADPATECATIRVPGAVFAAVRPRHDELRHLAHTRTVHADTGLRGEAFAAGEFSVIVANRLPNPGDGRHVVHLVSLEGCQAALDAAAGEEPPDVRLVSLHHWSFDCLPDEGAGFAPRVHDLLYDDDEDGGRPRDLLLRLPVPAPSEDSARARARERLEQGWVPLPYQVASGEETYAWYRGPFTATPAQPLPEPPEDGWTDAGRLLGYDPEWGVYDTGRASAWTLGRALALADDDFGAGLSAWRGRARHRAAVVAQRLAAAGPDAGEAELARLAGPRATDRALETLARAGAAERLIRALNDPPAARPARTAPTPRPAPPARPLHRVLAQDRARPVLREALRTALDTDGERLAAWFARLRLLYDVPFAHLVPSEAMLPPESLRFFHVDHGWLTALQAGAESLGVTGVTDTHLAALAAPWAGATRTPDDSWPRAGLLIRSALIRECPELIVRGWQNGEPVTLLRRRALENDVLLVLFDRVPDEVELSEPPEGLSFGVDPHPVDGVPVLNLRSLGAGGVPAGTTLEGVYFPQEPGDHGIGAHLRPDPQGRRVLDLRPGDADGLLRGLTARLAEAGQPATASPAVLALQLVNAPFRQKILTDPLSGGSPS
ncbi:hypothetical protein ACQEVS_00600 [Streptomyces sp. CA-181903]|uniref:hypothetical protein n=1 Tax=Streptomyces sp. CA-181903 TaxID=3240055 RepID=UPI003D924934